MGGAIHKNEGFYFRHDSVKNPSFESKKEVLQEVERVTRKHSKMTTQEIERAIVRKFEF